MNEQLKELFKKAFNEGAMYEATLSNAYSFDSFIEDNIEQLRLYGVVGRSEQLQGFFEFYKQKFGGGFNTDVLEITLKQYQETL